MAANSEDRSVILRRGYPRVPGEEPLVESIELHLSDLPAIEAALLNARMWLERATKQALKAAEEIEQGDHCARCDHPFHHGRRCDSCGCRVCHNCWHSDYVHTTNGCHAPACRCPISGELL